MVMAMQRHRIGRRTIGLVMLALIPLVFVVLALWVAQAAPTDENSLLGAQTTTALPGRGPATPTPGKQADAE